MKLLRDLDDLPDNLRHGAVAIGKFDGVHLGHARIVERLLEMARQVRGPALAFTFDPSPAQILRPALTPPPLCGTERKAELLTELGVDAVVAYPTDEDFLRMDARVFFDRILRGRIDAKAIVEGPDFAFGHRRLGTVQRLRKFCDETAVLLEVVERLEIDGQTVSSSRIRALLQLGEMEQARTMLGRPYSIRGLVVRGAGRGAELGYPTVNLGGVSSVLPREGIYAGRASCQQGIWPAAISIGPNPTFDEKSLKVEAHLIGYQGSLYDQNVELDFLARLREIRRFDSVDQLVCGMQRDVAATRQIVEQYGYSRSE